MAESGQQNPGFSSDWSDPTSQPQPFNKLLAPNKYCAPNESYNATPNQVVFAQQQPAADVNAASNQPPNQAPNKYVADSNQAGVFTTQHRHKRLMIVAFGALLLASSVIKCPICHIQILYNRFLVWLSAVVTGVATLIGMLGLVALLLAVWGLVRKKRGHSGRSLWVAALWVGSILIAIEVAGWAVLAAYLARKARNTRARCTLTHSLIACRASTASPLQRSRGLSYWRWT